MYYTSIFEGSRPIIQVGDPEIIKQVLVEDFRLFNTKIRITNVGHPIIDRMLVSVRGEQWRRMRAAVQPAFTTARTRRHYPLVRQCVTEQLVSVLEGYAREGQPCELKRTFGCYSLSVINRSAFGIVTDPHSQPRHPFVRTAWPLIVLPVWKLLALQVLSGRVLKAFGLTSIFNEKTIDNICDNLKGVLKARERLVEKSNDFLGVFMRSKLGPNEPEPNDDIEGENSLEMKEKTFDNNMSDNKKLTEEEILAQGFFIYFTAFDQISNVLSFCVYELALNPDVQHRLYEEIAAAVDADGEIGYDELCRLPLLDAVISETQRLHGGPIKYRRIPGREFPLGDTGIVVPKGQPIEILVYAIHHSEEYFPNALQFIPDRFLPENRHNIKPYTFMPFSTGPRVCVGMAFALMELKLALVHVLRRFRFAVHKDTKVPPIIKTHPVMKAPKTMYLSVEARD
ncbi:unnamed protein product [Medioppia subpectinata]|uniref:Cytochrome P450 n=1 Tax=Medioppia subpectinata TaxID=1979941 RepID=A0A7R9KV86_9ACAR|nr:unnamed protein product [Medioppia subpectinata]CAG2110101.1 unnamed protein product [Medioppia subpectinata]